MLKVTATVDYQLAIIHSPIQIYTAQSRHQNTFGQDFNLP